MKNKVFGIGLSRTGTRSLAAALNQLGWNCIHYPDDEVTFRELREGNFRLSVLRTHDAMTDTPAAPYFADLDRAYPGSKFVLTVREPEGWLQSAERLWRMTADLEDDFTRFINTAVYGCWAFSPERFRYVRERHTESVRSYFDTHPEDLLILDICAGDGWEKLCPFLGVPVPAEPFPHHNNWADGPERAFL